MPTSSPRTRHGEGSEPEYELSDTGLLDDNRFFDITVLHAKAAPDDICVEIVAYQPRPRCGAPASRAAAVVPQHVGLGP